MSNSSVKAPVPYDGKEDVYPSRFSDIKKEISKGNEEAIIKSWNELLVELAKATQVGLKHNTYKSYALTAWITQRYAETGPSVSPERTAWG